MSRSMSFTNILDLPIELYNEIFQYLQLVYSGRLRCLTKLTLEPSHTFIDYPHSPIGFKGELTDEILMTFSRTSGKFLKSLTLKTTANSNHSENECRRNLTDKSLKYFFEQAVNIEKIELVDVAIREFETLEGLGNLTKLDTLIFSNCRFQVNNGKVISLPNLKKLKIMGCTKVENFPKFSTENLEILFAEDETNFPSGQSNKNNAIPSLDELYLQKKSYRVDHQRFSAQKISERFPNIRVLELRKSYFQGKFDEPLTRLEFLDFAVDHGHEYLFDELKFFPELKELRIAEYSPFDVSKTFDTKLLRNFPQLFPQLETLELRNISSLEVGDVEKLLDGMKGLQVARFPNCRKIVRLSLLRNLPSICPSLKEVELAWPNRGMAISEANNAGDPHQAEEMIKVITGELLVKLDKVTLRGFPPKFYPELETYKRIELIPKNLPLVYIQKPPTKNVLSFSNYNDDDNIVRCGCGKEIDKVEFSQKHQFVCKFGRMKKFEVYENILLTCKMCGLEGIKKKNYERHIILHEEHVSFDGGWICKCTGCREYVLRKKKNNETESLDQHLLSCEKMIVMCNACGKEIRYSDYEDHIEKECSAVE